MSVIQELISPSLKKNELVARIFNNLCESIHLIWVPSHCGIDGNNFADESAKDGLKLRDIPNDANIITIQDYKILKKNYLYKIKLEKWLTESENKFRKIYESIDYPAMFSTNRKIQMIVNRLRAGHIVI